jgi:membrane protein required for colicin V production
MFDIIVFAFIGILTIVGLWKGLVKQLFGLLGVIAGYLLAVSFYQTCSKFFTSVPPGTARIMSFVTIFLACILAAHLIGWGVGRLLAISKLGFFNRIGGGLLGFFKGCIIISVMVMVLTAFLPGYTSLFKKSSTIKYILPVTAALKKVTHEDIKTKYNEKIGKEKPTLPKQKRGKAEDHSSTPGGALSREGLDSTHEDKE